MAEEKPQIEALKEHNEQDLSDHTSNSDNVNGRDFTVDEDELPKGYFRSARFLGSMFGIGAGLGAGTGSFTLIAPVLSFINADIGPSKDLTWVALAYLLSTSIAFPFVGRLSDIFGRRWFFIAGNVIATIGSIVCATAQDIHSLIAGEVILGLASASQIFYGRKVYPKGGNNVVLRISKPRSVNWSRRNTDFGLKAMCKCPFNSEKSLTSTNALQQSLLDYTDKQSCSRGCILFRLQNKRRMERHFLSSNCIECRYIHYSIFLLLSTEFPDEVSFLLQPC